MATVKPPRRARGKFECGFWQQEDGSPFVFTFEFVDTAGLLRALRSLPTISVGETDNMGLEQQTEALKKQAEAAERLFERGQLEPALSFRSRDAEDPNELAGADELLWSEMHPSDRNGLLTAVAQWSSLGKGAAAELASFPGRADGRRPGADTGPLVEEGPKPE